MASLRAQNAARLLRSAASTAPRTVLPLTARRSVATSTPVLPTTDENQPDYNSPHDKATS